MFNRFRDSARRVMGLARQCALAYQHDYIGTEHLLLGLLELPREELDELYRRCRLIPDRVRDTARSLITRGQVEVPTAQLPFTPRAKKVLEESLACAKRLGHGWIGPPHLLVGLLAEEEGIAAVALGRHGVDARGVEKALGALWPPDPADPDDAALRATPRRFGHASLDAFAEDLDAEACEAAERFLVRRPRALRTLEAILCRRRRPHALVVGPAGVGRTTLGLSLACALREGDARGLRADGVERVVRASAAWIVAGSKLHGQVEERLLALAKDLRMLRGETVLLLDDLDCIFLGAMFRGLAPLSVLLKPFTRFEEVRCIGIVDAAAWNEAKGGQASAFVDGFQEMRLAPPDRETTRAIVESWCAFHAEESGVEVEEAVAARILDLTERYRRDEPWPRSALDLLEHAVANARLSGDGQPRVGVDDVTRVLSDLTGIAVESLEADQRA